MYFLISYFVFLAHDVHLQWSDYCSRQADRNYVTCMQEEPNCLSPVGWTVAMGPPIMRFNQVCFYKTLPKFWIGKNYTNEERKN